MSIFSPQSWRKHDPSHVTLDQQLLGSLSKNRTISFRQLKYLHRVLTRREYRVIQILAILVCVNLAFLSFKAYMAMTVEAPRSGGTYTEGLVGSPSTINPLFLYTNDSDRDLASLVYSGLMRYTSQQELVPDLAERVAVSDDHKEYTFTLRSNVTWHDGEPFGANDVVFTISKIQDPSTKSPLYASYKDIVVKKKDDRTVVFSLSKPFAPFLDLMTVPLLPEHLWQELSSQQLPLSILNLKPIGTGPWKFRSLQKDKDGTIRSITLARNNEFYGTGAHIEKLVFKFYPDVESAVQGLKNRHVDGVSFVPRSTRELLEKDASVRTQRLFVPQYTALFFNTAGNKSLQSHDVRAALAFAIDKASLVSEGLSGEARIIDAPIPEGVIGYHPNVTKYSYDQARAKELLNSLKEPLSVEFVTVDSPEMVRVADMIKEMWERVGVKVAVTKESSGTMKELVLNPRKYDILLYGAVVGRDPDLYPFWHSSQVSAPGLNLAQFADKDADRLLTDARAESDIKKRTNAYHAFQDILAKELPALFLYSPTYIAVMTREIKGVTSDIHIAYPADRFSDLPSWYIKSERNLK